MFQKDKISHIVIDHITENPSQPRKTFQERALSELADSIREYGLLQPISVRKTGWDRYELIAGERRLRACKLIQMQKIPAIVIDVPPDKSAELALIENIQRENLNYFEEAEAYEKLLQRLGLTQKELADKIGKSQSFIANKLRLLSLEDKVKEIILREGLSERHARSILKIKDQVLQKKILEKAAAESLNVKQIEGEVQKNLGEKSTPKKQTIKFKFPERMLLDNLKKAVQEIKRSGAKVQYEEEIGVKEIAVTIKIKRETAGLANRK